MGGIIGSVISAPTVTANTLTSETVTFPSAGLQVVGIVFSGTYISIPLDPTRNAIVPNAGGSWTTSDPGQTVGAMRRVHFTIKGTSLTYSVYSATTTPIICFYYGTPLSGSQPLTNYSGVATAATLSSGSATVSVTFPSGQLKFTGVTATMGAAAASSVLELQWNTAPGLTFTAFVPANLLTSDVLSEDIIPLDMTVQQTLSVAVSAGTGSDKIVVVTYYQYQG